MVGKRKWKMLLWTGILLFACIMVLFIRWLREPLFPLQHGIKQVALTNGQVLYLKREAAGLFYDRLGLSMNGERCKRLDENRDYIFTSMGAEVFPVYFIPGAGMITVYAPLASPKNLN